jgi:hypothetical protein
MQQSSGVNILDKTDKSLAPMPGKTRTGEAAAGVEKRTKFAWSTANKKGIFMEIPKTQLNIDGRYQREQVSRGKVLEIARGWDWLMVGAISVIARSDGTYWVFDGGHRTRAAFYRDDINELPCMVHEIDDLTDEAKAFFVRNTMVSNVSAMARHRAAVCAVEPIAERVNELLDRCGLRVSDNKGADVIMCISEVTRCVAADAEVAERLIMFCRDMNRDGAPISGKLLRGMFTLHQRMKPRFDLLERFGDKIAGHSQKEIEIKLRQFAAECGHGGSAVEAKAILGIVNHKNKNRIEW